MAEYFPCANGNRPFRVLIIDAARTIKVFKQTEVFSRKYLDVCAYEFVFDSVFVGVDGCAILAMNALHPRHMFYIAEDVFEFDLEPGDEIVAFHARASTSDIAVAWIDGERNSYAINERTYIPKYLRGRYETEDRAYNVYDQLFGMNGDRGVRGCYLEGANWGYVEDLARLNDKMTQFFRTHFEFEVTRVKPRAI